MSDNIELTLILRNTEAASRDAKAALEATQRFIVSLGSRLGALEGRFSALESRTSGIEQAMDEIARSNHRMEQTLSAILDLIQIGRKPE